MRRPLLVSILAAGLLSGAGATWIWLRPSAIHPPAPELILASDAPADEISTREVVEDDPAAWSTERVPDFPSKKSRSGATPIQIGVLDAQGVAVEGAFVAWIDSRSASFHPAAHAEALSTIPWQERDHELYRTDRSGRVRLPRQGPRGLVLVMAPEGSGWGACKSHAADSTNVSLAEARTVLVRVVDVAGVPLAGVPVTSWSRGGVSSEHIMSGTTRGDEGLERLLATAPSGPKARRKGKLASDASCWIGLEIPLANDVLVRADEWKETYGPLDLRLPATAPLKVALLASDGQPCRDRAHVSLLAVNGDVASCLASCEGNARRALQRLRDRAWTLPARGGLVDYPFVGLGTELVAFVEAGGSREVSMTRFSGPEEAGTVKLRTIDVGPSRPTIRGRLVGLDGAALAKGRMSFEHMDTQGQRKSPHGPRKGRHGKHKQVGRHSFETDANGRFEVMVDRSWAGERLEFVLGRTSGSTRVQAIVVLPGVLPAGPVEIGDVPLALPPTLAAGIVRDATGAPIDGARVSLRLPDSPDGIGGTMSWNNEGIRAESDPEGRFVLRSDVSATVVQVRCEMGGFLSLQPVEVLAGRDDLELQLVAAASLAGSFQEDIPTLDRASPLSIGVLAHPSVVVATNGAEAQRAEHWIHQPVRTDGSFTFSSLPPGTADVRVMLEAQKEPLMEIAGVVLTSGELSRDPRLQDIELPIDLHRIEVHVEGANGAAIANALARRTDEAKHRVMQVGAGGELSLLTTAPIVPLQIWAEGYRALEVVARSGDTFVLAPDLLVRVEVIWDPAILAAGSRPSVELEPLAASSNTKKHRRSQARIQPQPGGATQDSGSERVGRAEFTFAVATPGPYEVHASFSVPRRPQKAKAPRSASGGTIQVYESSGEQSFRVQLSPTAAEPRTGKHR